MAPEKLFTVGQAAKKLGVVPKTLKTWEKDGEIPLAARDRNNNRVYTDEEIEEIRRIKRIGEIRRSIPGGQSPNDDSTQPRKPEINAKPETTKQKRSEFTTTSDGHQTQGEQDG